MDPITITALGALGTVLIALKPWAEQALNVEEKYRREVKDAAQKVLDALNQTEAYLKRGVSSQQAEDCLVQAWHHAATELYGVNDSLAQLCYLKGEHWKAPEQMSAQEVAAAGLSIEHVKEAIEKLLFAE